MTKIDNTILGASVPFQYLRKKNLKMKSIGHVIGCQTFITGDNITFNVLQKSFKFFSRYQKGNV